MRWRWWKTRREKVELVLRYLEVHGESYALDIFKGTGIARYSHALLHSMADDGLLGMRPEPEGSPSVLRQLEAYGPPLLQRNLYRLEFGGRAWLRTLEASVHLSPSMPPPAEVNRTVNPFYAGLVRAKSVGGQP